jgi:hypothetical protein
LSNCCGTLQGKRVVIRAAKTDHRAPAGDQRYDNDEDSAVYSNPTLVRDGGLSTDLRSIGSGHSQEKKIQAENGMAAPKYRYEKPKNVDQYLEAVYEELSLSPRENGRYRSNETLKDHVAALLDHAKSTEWQRKNEKETESYAVTWALGALAALTAMFLANGFVKSGDWTWLDHHRFTMRLWGITFAAVFVGVSIERSSFFKSVWAFGFTKLVASLAVSALIIFSTGKASSLINSVFSVDASALPFTRAIVAGLLAFQYSYPLLIVVAVFAILHALHAVEWISLKFSGKGEYKAPPLQSIAFLSLSLVILFSFTRWVNKDFSDEMWPAKVYRLAHVLDFNSKYECVNLRKGLSVVFLGAEQARVLVDMNKAQTNDMESFVDGSISSDVEVPQQFYVVPCEPRR